MHKYQAVIFDVDGTLLDSHEGIISSVVFTIAKLNLIKLSAKELSRFVGPPIQESFMKFYGLPVQEAQEAAKIFRDQYKQYDLLKAQAYEGIFDLLDSLKNKNIKIAYATYKRQDYAYNILKHFGFVKYSNLVYGADNTNQLKKADIVKNCLVDINAEKDHILLIGDSEFDGLAASENKLDFAAVTYGFGFKSEADAQQYNPIVTFHTVQEIIDFFNI